MCGLFRHAGAVTLLLIASEFAITQTQPPDNGSSGTAPNASAAPATSGGVYRIGGGVSPPRPIYAPDPDYADEARRERIQGTCFLWLVVSAEGLPRDIRVKQPLGHGLDEKAIEAVKRWRFEPAQKDGKPVAVMINVEVTFHLYNDALAGRIMDLERRANAGDAKAELELSEEYLQGEETGHDERAGYRLLLQAANQGLPKAQFRMGEYTASKGDRPGDYIVAYMWYALAERNGYKQSGKKLKELSAKMSAENIAEAQAQAQNWTKPPDTGPR
jgi:TonB family protein